MNKSLFNPPSFLLGVNYWPRKSGVRMWRDFSAQEIEQEFRQIHELGMDTVRVFPLWDDFQPIYELPACGNVPYCIGLRHDWNVSPLENPEMMDEAMLEKFDQVVALASKYHLKLIVALLTAWMSGVLFNPSWKGGRNLFSDSFMLKYQMLYCRAFAKRYAHRPEILAWEYGNEQNCADNCELPETAWVWLHSLAAELRLNDPETPVGSGMHGLRNRPEKTHPWGIGDNADATDFLTTHPYPLFTPGCLEESPTSLRANLHATAESRYYADLGKRPVLCEETGSLGNCVLSETLAGAYLRLRLYSLFANGISGCLWWCFSDFACGDQFPYRVQQMENDGLGLTAADGRIKAVGCEMRKFRAVVDQFGGRLPEMKRPAAILVSELTDDWLSIFNCYVLCVQAGMAPRLVRPGYDDLSSCQLLLAPSLSSTAPLSAPAWQAVQSAVKNGATLYVSGNGVNLTNMDTLFGIPEMELLPLRNRRDEVTFDCGFRCGIQAKFRNQIVRCTSEVLGRCSDGTPALVRNRYGRGTAYFLNLPLELSLSEQPFATEDESAWLLYAVLRDEAGIALPADVPDPLCERLWNGDGSGHGWLTVINHRREELNQELRASQSIKTVHLVAGEGNCTAGMIHMDALQVGIFEITFA